MLQRFLLVAVFMTAVISASSPTYANDGTTTFGLVKTGKRMAVGLIVPASFSFNMGKLDGKVPATGIFEWGLDLRFRPWRRMVIQLGLLAGFEYRGKEGHQFSMRLESFWGGAFEKWVGMGLLFGLISRPIPVGFYWGGRLWTTFFPGIYFQMDAKSEHLYLEAQHNSQLVLTFSAIIYL